MTEPTSSPQRPPLLPWLWRSYLSEQKGQLGLGFVLMMVEGSMLGLLSYMMLPMFDRVFVEGSTDALWGVAFAILGIFIARPYCRFLCPYGVLLNWTSRFSWKHMIVVRAHGNFGSHVGMSRGLGFHTFCRPGAMDETL